MYRKCGRYSLYRLGRRKNDLGDQTHIKAEEIPWECGGAKCVSELMFVFHEFQEEKC
ncbi:MULTISPECIES: hypothetical protein [Holospora]|uniref:Uncharacterized protein n=2 Tax=Holospora TaxID=44747 RepID=A0A061JH30_9PROT|nr:MULTISPECIES: hypothetical protein [Holospora]ETZ05435.1 hypothetical protein K737_300116 [Holospora undulata HU1]GAJ46382.1 hypothetical protein HE1_00715 [Holospora elegans E1]